jgi:DNA-binding transcriptional regulator YiaG
MSPADLLAWRVERGLTQVQLAALVSRTRQSVQNWERGRAVPDGAVLALLDRINRRDIERVQLGKRTC